MVCPFVYNKSKRLNDDAGSIVPAAFFEGFFGERLRVVVMLLREHHSNLVIEAHIGKAVAADEDLTAAELDRLSFKGFKPDPVVIDAEEGDELVRIGAAAGFFFVVDTCTELLSREGMVLRELSYIAAAVVVDAAVAEVIAVDEAVLDADERESRAAPAALFLDSHAANGVVCGIGVEIHRAGEVFLIGIADKLGLSLKSADGYFGGDIAEGLAAHAVANGENTALIGCYSTLERAVFFRFYTDAVGVEIVLVVLADESDVGNGRNAELLAGEEFVVLSAGENGNIWFFFFSKYI